MRNLVVLGAGTAGTIVVNRLHRRLGADWRITVVDRDDEHHYQPGYLFVPFGRYRPEQLVRSRRRQLPLDVRAVLGSIERVDTDNHVVHLEDGRTLPYDQLVIATGSTPRPDQTPGMEGSLWREDVFDFYSLDGASALRDRLADWQGGRLVVHVAELPIKCPVAPLEFAFLADAWFRERGMRDDVDITYVTPLDGAFTKPTASAVLGGMLAERDIHLEPDFVVERVDEDEHALVSFDERRVAFDLLVTTPLHMGEAFVGRSGLGDELDHVRVDPHTFQSVAHDDVFALGDAADLPTSKAGSVAHFAAEVFVENFLEHVEGRPMTRSFDGHANCFVESGDGRALLLDFNYETEPLPGEFPLPGVGPMSLLKETRRNHAGKLGFRWLYWHALLPGRPLPISTDLSLVGKQVAPAPDTHPAPPPDAQSEPEPEAVDTPTLPTF